MLFPLIVIYLHYYYYYYYVRLHQNKTLCIIYITYFVNDFSERYYQWKWKPHFNCIWHYIRENCTLFMQTLKKTTSLWKLCKSQYAQWVPFFWEIKAHLPFYLHLFPYFIDFISVYACKWRSEDNSWESVLCTTWVPGIKLRSSVMVTAAFTHWIISLALLNLIVKTHTTQKKSPRMIIFHQEYT